VRRILPAALSAGLLVPLTAQCAGIPVRSRASQVSVQPHSQRTPDSQAFSNLRFLAIDKDGNPVTDLRADELQVRIDKTEQKILSLALAADEPLTIGFFFDISGSRLGDSHLEKEISAAIRFVDSIWHLGDTGFVVAFNERIYPLAKPTNELPQVEQALQDVMNTSDLGSTSLYDAICSVHVNVQKQPAGDTLFVIMSDFEDNTSRNSKEIALDVAWSENARIIPFLLGESFGADGSKKSKREAQKAAHEFSEKTGGDVLEPSSEKDLGAKFQRLANELKGAYRVRYEYPSSGELKHKLEVKTTRPHVRLLYAKD
jgi:VWFA-related protein